MLFLGRSDVRRLLPMAECIEVMARVLSALARGEADNPLRRITPIAGAPGFLGLMPGSLASPPIAGLKVVSVFLGNRAGGLESHQGLVLLFESARGEPLAALEASELTAIRTAAVSALATRLLAREDAAELALLGSGAEARTHLEALTLIRAVRRVRVYSPNDARRRAFAAEAAATHGIPVEAVPTAREAVSGADLVCTLTSSRQPVLEGSWLAPGAHVNAVGACTPQARELDTAAVLRSRLFVDRRESALSEAGDILIPRAEGALSESHIVGELADVLLGRLAGRRSAEEITLFKSLGIAVEDLAAAHHVYERARASGAGTNLPW